MTIEELIKKVETLSDKEEINLRVAENEEYIAIERLVACVWFEIIKIGNEKPFKITKAENPFFEELPEKCKKRIINLLVNFKRPPIKEKGTEKKYQYRLKEKHLWISRIISKEVSFINLEKTPMRNECLTLCDNCEKNGCKCNFTDKEMEEIAYRFDIDLTMFDKIEVE